MDRIQLGAGVLMVTVTSVALGISPHAVCKDQSETIGCKHDEDIHQHEPEGPLRGVQTMSANGGSTGNVVASPPPGTIFFDSFEPTVDISIQANSNPVSS